MVEEKFTCRIQYLNDGDPFVTTSTCYLEPMRQVTFSFQLHTPIGDQIGDVIRSIRAPHKSGDAALQLFRKLENGADDFGTYLDSDMTLSEQQDELQILQNDPEIENSKDPQMGWDEKGL